MADIGVCTNAAYRCSLSFERPSLGYLFQRLDALERHRAAGSDANVEIPLLKPFLEFFQAGSFCKECGCSLAHTIQPTKDLAPDSEEYRRIVRLNQVLDSGYRLQSLGLIPL
jgi:hypothetical protein